MREYSPRGATVVVDGLVIVLNGRTFFSEHEANAELARLFAGSPAAREVSTAGTATTASSAAEIRLYAEANGFGGLSPYDALDYEPAFPAPPPPVPRRIARPVPVRRPPAAPRLVSWLVEGRGR